MKRIILLGTIIMGILPFSGFAQKKHPKFGKFSDEEISMKVYDQDTSASAVVLWDIGESTMPYNTNSGFDLCYKRFQRIKILKKEGYEYARFEFYLRKNGERLGSYSACTFNMEDGKLVKTKLDKDLVIKEPYNKNWDMCKFEMPAIKEGSIIDIEYTISTSDGWDIRNWSFQGELPVVYSEYYVSIPEYFYYKQLEKGYIPIGQHLNESKVGSIIFPGYEPLRFTENEFTYICENVPAFHEEAFIDCADNYTTSITFELGSYKPPYGMIKNFTQTWKAIGEELMKETEFGAQLDMALFLNETADQINQKFTDPKEKLIAGYSYIQNYMTWNKSNGMYSYQGLRKAYNEKQGNAGDINLMLVALLKKLGIDANPVILSTRSNGKIHPAQLIIDQYNYAIASAVVNGQRILLDATDKFAPAGMLPERCLNEQGRLINENGGDWVAIKPSFNYKTSYSINLKIGLDEPSKGTLVIKDDDYSAAEKRWVLLNYSEDSKFIEDFNKGFDGVVFSLDSITGRKEVGSPLVSSFSFESEKVVEQAGNLLMINPFLVARSKENPFKLEERNYPVDFSYPYSQTYMATIELPDGYSVESMPETKRLVNTDKTAQFMLSVQQLGNKITVIWKFDIKKVIYLPDEYAVLKEFYNQIVDLESKQIVLKKI